LESPGEVWACGLPLGKPQYREVLMDKSTVVDFPSNHVFPEVRSDAFALFSCADWQAAKLPSA